MNANVPTTYKGILNLLNFSLKVPESTADGIEESVRDAVSNWLPYITIQNVFEMLR